jgi:hypothetical protein
VPDPRRTFLVAATTARDLVARDEVGMRWDEPSALAEFSVRGLAGHLIGRTVAAVLEYLDRDEPPTGGLLDASAYYAAVLTTDIDDDLNRGVRARGEAASAAGREGLLASADDALAVLASRLPGEREDRRVEVVAGLALTLDQYLVTRLVELLVHTDDLASSVGVSTPEPDPEAADLVIACLTDLARLRHGDVAVLRALGRRERDTADALRVL